MAGNIGIAEFDKAVPNAFNVVHVKRGLLDIPERVVANISAAALVTGGTQFTTSTPHGLSTGEWTVLQGITAQPTYNGFFQVVMVSNTIFNVIGLTFVATVNDGTSSRALADDIKYVVSSRIPTATGFTIGDGSRSAVTSNNFEPNIGIRYTGVGNLFESVNFGSLELVNLRIDTDATGQTGTKGKVFDMTGNPSPQTNPVLTLTRCLFTRWDSLGEETDLIHIENDCTYLFYKGGFTQTRVLSQVHNYAWEGIVPGALVLYTKKGQTLFQGANSFTKGLVNVQADQYLFDISPDIGIAETEITPILIDTTNKRGLGDYFKPGLTGNITGFAAQLNSGGIDSVTNQGGIAQFEAIAHGMQVGQIVEISDFVSNLTYNGLFEVGVATANAFQVIKIEGDLIAFTGTETVGGFASPVTIVTAPSHGLSQFTTLIIQNTIGYSDFGLGYQIFGTTTNAFLINHEFDTLSGDTTGIWNTGSLTQEDERVFADGNTFLENTTTAGGFFTSPSNGTATPIALADTPVNLLFDAATINEISTTERTRLVVKTDGEIEIRSKEPFNGFLNVSLFGTNAAGANRTYHFTATKNEGPMTNLVSGRIDIGSGGSGGSLIIPVEGILKDKIHLQVEGIGHNTDITITDISAVLVKR